MYGFSRPIMPNDMHWNRYRPPQNPQWRPFHGPRAQVPHFRPRNPGFYNQRPQIQSSSEEYWCETCDRGFHTEDLLSKHKQQHQKCNIDGCQFIAHPKVITKHIQMQHSSGLYKKIAKLNNPEEIEKWKEERRKRYPTKSTIDKKAAELKEKIDRGETIGLGRRDWRGQKGSKLNGDHKRKFGQGIMRRSNDENNHPGTKFRKLNNRKPRKPPNSLPEPENNRNLAPFAGIQTIEMDFDEIDEDLHSNDLIEDEDVETFNPDPATAAMVGEILNVKPVVCGALSSLICEYGSSDEDIESTSNTDNKLGTTNGYCETNTPLSTSFLSKKETVNCQNNLSNKNFKQNTPQKSHDPNKIEKSSLDGNNIKQDKNDAVSDAENHSENIQQNFCIKNGDSSNSSRPDELSEKDSISDVTKKDVNIKHYDDDDDDSGPEEVKVDRNGQSANNDSQNCNYENKTKLPKKRVGVVRKQPCYKKPKPKLPSTLIYRLLSKEMKQERNKVLQCIRYIRKNNYFDKDTK